MRLGPIIVLALAATVMAAAAAPSSAQQITILNVSYDPTREWLATREWMRHRTMCSEATT